MSVRVHYFIGNVPNQDEYLDPEGAEPTTPGTLYYEIADNGALEIWRHDGEAPLGRLGRLVIRGTKVAVYAPRAWHRVENI